MFNYLTNLKFSITFNSKYLLELFQSETAFNHSSRTINHLYIITNSKIGWCSLISNWGKYFQELMSHLILLRWIHGELNIFLKIQTCYRWQFQHHHIWMNFSKCKQCVIIIWWIISRSYWTHSNTHVFDKDFITYINGNGSIYSPIAFKVSLKVFFMVTVTSWVHYRK